MERKALTLLSPSPSKPKGKKEKHQTIHENRLANLNADHVIYLVLSRMSRFEASAAPDQPDKI